MKLVTPFIQLPLFFDAPSLAAEIEKLGDRCWRPHPQGYPGNSMLPLIAVDGDPADESFSGKMQPTPELLDCPYVMQVLGSLGATLGRTRLMRLAGRAEVIRHIDQGYYWIDRVRVHVPIITQPTVRFECGHETINMAQGECWIFDTWRQHRVVNDATQSRIHLVCDTVGGDEFWRLAAKGSAIPVGTSAQSVMHPDASAQSDLAYEVINVPKVMTPWEMKAHFSLLFEDATPHPCLDEVRHICNHFVRAWLAAWARFGEDQIAVGHYKALLDKFVNEVRKPSETIYLKNEILWFRAMGSIIAKGALSSSYGHG